MTRTHESPPAFRFPSISLWGILVFLVRDFGLYGVVAAVLGAVLGGALSTAAGALLGFQITGSWISDSGVVLKIAGYALLVVVTLFYGAAGLAGGFVVSVISFVIQQTEVVEKELHEFLEPITQSLVARIPFGQDGIPVEAFADVFDPIIEKLYSETRPKRFFIFSAGTALARFAFRQVMRAIRWAVDEFFVEELQEEGVTHVNMTQMERFVREELAELVLDRYTLQLKIVRRLILAVMVLLILIAFGISGGIFLF